MRRRLVIFLFFVPTYLEKRYLEELRMTILSTFSSLNIYSTLIQVRTLCLSTDAYFILLHMCHPLVPQYMHNIVQGSPPKTMQLRKFQYCEKVSGPIPNVDDDTSSNSGANYRLLLIPVKSQLQSSPHWGKNGLPAVRGIAQ